MEYLHSQAKGMQRAFALLAMISWLHFGFFLDPELHPEFPELLYFRLGLSAVGLIVFAATFFDRIRGKGLGLLHLMLAYMLFSCAYFTGRIADDPSYIAGFMLVIAIATFMPSRLIVLYRYYMLSIIIFVGAILIHRPDINSYNVHYSMNNLVIAYVFAGVMGFMLEKYRFQTFLNQHRITQSNKDLLYEIAEREQAEEALRDSEERYRSLVEQASEIIIRTDGTGNITFVNPAGFSVTGYTEKELVGKQYLDFVHPDERQAVDRFFGRQFVKKLHNTYFEYPLRTKEGNKVWLGQNTQVILKDGRTAGFQAVARDLTEHKKMEAEIMALSITDQLTGLHNRRGFLSLAGQQLKIAEREKNAMLLLFADLDWLKWINDTLGHDEGDRALMEAAAVFKETFRTSDIVARLGGDEYAALVVDVTEADFEIISARLQSQIDMKNSQENRKYKLSISVGCSYYNPANPCTIDELIASADKLMYEQKQSKKCLLLQGEALAVSSPYYSAAPPLPSTQL
ncbi:MAG: diguanylate cyclase [Syntrophaceae bacterium]|nr:diguanylate cyclase [Syntrophaceae bacterium]